MSYYPATVIAVEPELALVRIDATGHVIRFRHNEHNALPPELRQPGIKGVISFPKAPPQFSTEAAA